MSSLTHPLEGIRVIDFTRMLAGPYLTMNLADLGAEVLKVEEPAKGDDTRGFPPFGASGESSFFTGVNRSKRSIAIDLKHAQGQAVARELILKADIVAENFRAGVMARYGLDYESLRPDHPGLIYCSVTGYGHGSPLREVGGYDPIAQAEAGLMELTGFADAEPVRAGGSIVDTFTGAMAGQAVLAALIARGKTGEGQFVDISLLDCALSALTHYAQGIFDTGKDQNRAGNSSVFMVPMDIYQCSDGPVLLIASSDRQFAKLCTEIFEDPGLAEDARFANMAARVENRAALDEIVAGYMRKRTRQDWIERMRPTGIVVGNVRRLSEAVAAPEVLSRGMIVDVGDGQDGEVTVGSPFFLSETKVRPPQPAQHLGADTDAVLAEVLDYSPARIAELRQAGALGKIQE